MVFQVCLFENAANRRQRQILLRMRDCHFAWLGRMFELVMRSHDMNKKPSILFQSPDDFLARHPVKFYTILHKNQSAFNRIICMAEEIKPDTSVMLLGTTKVVLALLATLL